LDFLPERKFAQLISKKHSLTLPIDILEIIQLYADYEEDTIPYKVDAVCINKAEKALVILNLNQSENRKRFTLAHELGHLIIPWHVGLVSCHTNSNYEVNSSYSKMESEANSFAAELLMPTHWLIKLVSKYEKNGLTFLLELISRRAEVSLYAAIYSLFNVLPRGYIAFIKQQENDYGQRLESEGTEITIPYKDGMVDQSWLNQCAIKSDTIDLDSYSISWWKVERDISDSRLNTIVSENEHNGLTKIFKVITNQSKKTLPTVFPTLISMLPFGYVIILQGEESKIFRSHGTEIVVYAEHGGGIDFQRLNHNCIRNGEYPYNDYVIYWWKFAIDTPPEVDVNDRRLSKEIIKNILSEVYYDDSDRKRFLMKVNGVIGAANSRFVPDNIESLYKQLIQKFTAREEFEDITSHPEFNYFLIKRAQEIFSRQ